MGAPETVPFGKREAAEAFAKEYGGSVLRLDGIEDALVLAPVEIDPPETGMSEPHMHHAEPRSE
jgi:nitrous oxide reductase accessory protein NosL